MHAFTGAHHEFSRLLCMAMTITSSSHAVRSGSRPIRSNTAQVEQKQVKGVSRREKVRAPAHIHTRDLHYEGVYRRFFSRFCTLLHEPIFVLFSGLKSIYSSFYHLHNRVFSQNYELHTPGSGRCLTANRRIDVSGRQGGRVVAAESAGDVRGAQRAAGELGITGWSM